MMREEHQLSSGEELSDVSFEDEAFDGSNIFSDPESEWGVEMNKSSHTGDVNCKSQPIIGNITPDSRPEVDQPQLYANTYSIV